MMLPMIKQLLAFTLLCSIASAELEVHEWGTFTTLSDSTGTILSWYSPQSDHSALPKFVKHNPAFTKSAMITKVRMETPVIYFYPDKPMTVQVEANFKNGTITEIYPDSLNQSALLSYNAQGFLSSPTMWKGRLLPPNNAKAIAMIPTVSSDDRGAHYAAARMVPDAWIFHHEAKFSDPTTQEVISEDQAEKFIFYRGAGNLNYTPTISNKGGSAINFRNYSKYDLEHGVLLEVRHGKARWSTLPSISKIKENVELVSTAISGDWQSLDKTETELTHRFQNTLTAQGLTSAEAAAMIATWQGSWFRESGMRAFTIMPRAQVDEILPLNITPQPEKLVRVFVNRHELISDKQENELASLMLDLRIPKDEAKNRLQKLELGRFEPASIQRALEIGRGRMYSRYSDLTKSTPND